MTLGPLWWDRHPSVPLQPPATAAVSLASCCDIPGPALTARNLSSPLRRLVTLLLRAGARCFPFTGAPGLYQPADANLQTGDMHEVLLPKGLGVSARQQSSGNRWMAGRFTQQRALDSTAVYTKMVNFIVMCISQVLKEYCSTKAVRKLQNDLCLRSDVQSGSEPCMCC